MLKTLCLEYKDLLTSLLSNGSYQFQQMREAYTRLIEKYQEAARLIQQSNAGGFNLEVRTRRDVLFAEIDRLQKIRSSLTGMDSTREFESQMVEMKMAVVEDSLKEKGVAPVLTDGKVEFYKDQRVILSLPLDMSKFS